MTKIYKKYTLNCKSFLLKFVKSLVILNLLFDPVAAQVDTIEKKNFKYNEHSTTFYQLKVVTKPSDIPDILNIIFNRKKIETDSVDYTKLLLSIVPGIDYIPSSGLRFNATASLSSYSTKSEDQKLNTSSLIISYSLKKQKAITLFSNIWSKNNSYTLQQNIWYLNYPELTYGLGSKSKNNQEDPILFTYIRIYEVLLKKFYKNLYVGGGYKLDYHYGISEKGTLDGSISDLDKYGNKQKTISSGLSFDFLYDSRKNAINAKKSNYLSIVYSPKFTFLKSDNNWESLQLDARKYFSLSKHHESVLAIWSLLSFTYGRAPYFDLPSTGWDLQLKSSGRGYTQGRYRGNNMLYFETEYRFAISTNGLIGAVLFTNAQSFAETNKRNFNTIIPAAGGGLRIKLSKLTDTNLCLDYGFGIEGSRGFYVNIGEIF